MTENPNSQVTNHQCKEETQVEWEDELRFRLAPPENGLWFIQSHKNSEVEPDEWNIDHYITTHEASALETVDGVPDDQLRPGMLADAMGLLGVAAQLCQEEKHPMDGGRENVAILYQKIGAFFSGVTIPQDPNHTKALELLRRLEALDNGNDESGEYLYMYETLCVDNTAFLSTLDTENPNSQVTNHQCKEEADNE